jgi:hypothetical protein
MKKLGIAVFVLTVSFFVAGASVWEGAVAVSENLPETVGYDVDGCVATNSFPRNTRLTMTNLETGQEARVIVAAGLDAPGLLATLSRSAAEAVGLYGRSTGRVKMEAGDDAVDYSTLSEGGIGFDYFAPSPAASGDAVPVATPVVFVPGNTVMLDRPEFYTPPPALLRDDQVVPEPEITWSAIEVGDLVPLPPVAQTSPETSPPPMRTLTIILPDPAVPMGSEITVLPSPALAPLPAPVPASPLPPAAPPPAAPVPEKKTELAEPVLIINQYRLVPAEARPPAAVPSAPASPEGPMLPPVSASIPQTVPSPATQISRQDTILDPSLFIGPIVPHSSRPVTPPPAPVPWVAPPAVQYQPPAPSPPAPVPWVAPPAPQYQPPPPSPAPVPVVPPVPGRVQQVPSPQTAPAPWTAPVPRVNPVPPPAPARFSVPLISGLEWGKYYLQLGLYSRPEMVEAELSRIGQRYPLAVQNAGSPGSPLYRILLGPVSKGESGALLQRFKSLGYTDAFVRSN